MIRERALLVMAGAMSVVAACVSYAPTETTPGAAPSPDGLSAAFEPLFVAEFAETESALAAWRAFGGRILARYEDRVYPPVPIETFNRRAIERVRAFRSARPDATLEEFTYAALDGLFPADRLDGKYLHALIIWEADPSKLEMITFHDAARPANRAPKINERLEFVSESGVTMLAVPRLGRGDSSVAASLLRDYSGPLIVDLRGNGGGVVSEVVLMASLFVPPQLPLFTLQTVSGGQLQRSVESSTELSDIGAILIVVDEKTDMGALMLAAALADSGRASIAGSISRHPRGDVEVVWPWPDCYEGSERTCAVRIPEIETLRVNGAPLVDGIAVDYPWNPNHAALTFFRIAVMCVSCVRFTACEAVLPQAGENWPGAPGLHTQRR